MQSFGKGSKEALALLLRSLDERDRAVGAFVPEPGRDDRALSEFDAAVQRSEDAEQAQMLGLLIGVKDIINVDGLPTRAGSDLPPTLFEGSEASIVRRLRDVGGVIAGKTTSTEFAFSEPSRTRNPWDPGRTPGGSSSGSAAAVAANLVPVALGTQTVDSIVTPAAYCGVVGFKPSFGRMPLDGVVPFAPSMDHAGLLTKNVAMVRVVAPVLCDTWHEPERLPKLVGGIPADVYLSKAERPALDAFDAALQVLHDAGFTSIQTDALRSIDDIATAHRRLLAAEFATVHAGWFRQFGDRYRPRTARFYAEGADLPETVVSMGRSSGNELRQTLADVMQREGVTVWLSPAATSVAPAGLDYIGDPIMGLPWTHAHLPVVTLPIISATGSLPLGLQLAGASDADEELLLIADVIESTLRRSGLTEPRQPGGR